MVWIIVGFALALVIGPVLYFLPTRKERRIAAIRLEARRQGLVVELKPVRKLDADADERVTAGGERRCPVHDSVAYILPLRQTFERMPPWRLLKSERSGWVLDDERGVPPESDLAARLPSLMRGLPGDTVAVEFGGGTLACYWLERHPADSDTVRALKTALVALAEKLAEIDAE